MAPENARRDQNFVTVLMGVTNDVDQDTTMLRVDPVTKRLLVSATGGSGGGGTIGDPVVGGTPNEILYVDGAGNLADSDSLKYTDSTDTFQIKNIGATLDLLNISGTQRVNDYDGVFNFHGRSLDSQTGWGATVTVHNVDAIPFALSIYNDTFSSTVPGLSYYIDNSGFFSQNTYDQPMIFTTDSTLVRADITIGITGGITLGSLAGTGSSVVVADANGLLSRGGGASAGFQRPTGTVNGINGTFTFATAPNVIVVDEGHIMQKLQSDGLTANWTGGAVITLSASVAVPTFDIFSPN